jgi:uncharacterized membrane protein YfcA
MKVALIGLGAGFFSGLFGVGGGILIVPLLVLLLGFGQRLASGTSLTAILPTAIAGSIGYLLHGQIDWAVAACLAVGAIGGSLLGSWLLQRIPQGVLRWLFIAFQLAMAVRLFFLVPERDAGIALDLPTALALLALGVVTGILSGLLGVGGGVIVVPALMVFFGMGDLVAKGTSLVMMIPTSVTGTIANLRRGNTDVGTALTIGAFAIPASFGGVAVATVIPPALGSVLFALLLLFTAVQLAIRALRS